MTGRNVARYIRVNQLEQTLKDRLEDGCLPLVAAVDLSYLSGEEQETVSGLAEQGKIKLDASYFNSILTGDYDVTIQLKNTEHYWYLHNTEYPAEESCIIFHMHKASHSYHRHGKSENLRQAIKSIKGYDVFQMNGGKYI